MLVHHVSRTRLSSGSTSLRAASSHHSVDQFGQLLGVSAARSCASETSSATWYSSHTSSSNGASGSSPSSYIGPSGLNVTAFQPSW